MKTTTNPSHKSRVVVALFQGATSVLPTILELMAEHASELRAVFVRRRSRMVPLGLGPPAETPRLTHPR